MTFYGIFHENSTFVVAPKIVPFSASSNLQQGDRTTLTCTIARGDSPLTLSWLKDGAPVTSNNNNGDNSVKILNFDEFNSMLTIESLAIGHIGNYTCVAKNLAGESAVVTRIIVHGNPRGRGPHLTRPLFSLIFQSHPS